MLTGTVAEALGPLRDSWLLHLRAENKSERTRRSYGDSVSQFFAFLDDPPPDLDPEMAQALADAPAIDGPEDIEPVHVRAFIAHLLTLHKPSTASTRYNGLQQWFRWLVAEEEIKSSPMANLRPPALDEVPRRSSPRPTFRRSWPPARSAPLSMCGTRRSSGSSATPACAWPRSRV
jgi:site-specific recombinase XerD